MATSTSFAQFLARRGWTVSDGVDPLGHVFLGRELSFFGSSASNFEPPKPGNLPAVRIDLGSLPSSPMRSTSTSLLAPEAQHMEHAPFRAGDRNDGIDLGVAGCPSMKYDRSVNLRPKSTS